MGRPGSELGQTDPLSCDRWREGVPTAHHAAGARRELGSQSPSRGVGSEPQECQSAPKLRSVSHLHGDASESPPLSPWGAPPSSWGSGASAVAGGPRVPGGTGEAPGNQPGGRATPRVRHSLLPGVLGPSPSPGIWDETLVAGPEVGEGEL